MGYIYLGYTWTLKAHSSAHYGWIELKFGVEVRQTPNSVHIKFGGAQLGSLATIHIFVDFFLRLSLILDTHDLAKC